MADKNISDRLNLAKTFQSTFNRIAFLFKNAFPGVIVFAGHIIGGMITCNDHKRCQMNMIRVEIFQFIQKTFDGEIPLNCTHMHIGIAEMLKQFVHLRIKFIGNMLCSMSHK